MLGPLIGTEQPIVYNTESVFATAQTGQANKPGQQAKEGSLQL